MFRSINDATEVLSVQYSTLTPRYENRRSYYNKANIVTTTYTRPSSTCNGTEHVSRYELISYVTKVAMIEMFYDMTTGRRNESIVIYGTYSRTTLRHIREFIRQYTYANTDIVSTGYRQYIV